MPLTATAIRKAKAREKSRKLYDSRGLHLEIAPRGTKAWRFKYRFAGKEKRISMGISPEVSLKLARQQRDDARKLLARDIDPSAFRKAQKQSRRQGASNSFEAVATQWLTKHSPNWSTGWVRRLERELEREVFPYIGASPVAGITAPDLLAVVRRVEARGHLRKAHTVFQVCGRVLRYAVATGRAERDVSADLRGALPPDSRLPKIVPLLRELATEESLPECPIQRALIAQAARDAQEFAEISWVLPVDDLRPLRPRLQEAVFGTLGQTRHKAYQSQSELWTGAMLARSGVLTGVHIAGEGKSPDFIVKNGTMEYAVEVKRDSPVPA